MDKRTLLAIVISGIILMLWYGGQSSNIEENNDELVLSEDILDTQSVSGIISPVYDDIDNEEPKQVTIQTNIYNVVFSTKNATIQSLIYNNVTSVAGDIEKTVKDEDADIIPKGELDQAFRILWGDSTITDELQDINFNYRKIDNKSIEFYKNFKTSNDEEFTLKKIFVFKDDEHVFELSIQLTNKDNEILTIGNDYAYSLMFGPQLGPYAEIVDTQKSKQLSRRRLVALEGQKLRNKNLKPNRYIVNKEFYKWVGISGRYISMLILTGSTGFTTEFSTYDVEGLNSGAQILLRRPNIQSSASVDKYRIYLGPNRRSSLKKYNNVNDNVFGIQDANFDKAIRARLLGFLERILYSILTFLHTLVPNYGVVIIILTLIMRMITLPVIKKSKASGERMKQLAPKMQEIRTKYSEDPMRMNQEIMALYKKENVSPFSTMVPLLIQLPFFLAMYRVIYDSIELWQAPFFSWIIDLSVPDEFISFGNFTVPVLGWTSLHLLPIIMLGTQYVSSFIMMSQQDHSAGSPKLMFVMSYVFPFMIFFALYNSPSGLIIYWIFSNIFTVFTMANWKKKPTPPPIVVKKHKKK